MLGQSVIPKQLEEIKSKHRFLQDKTYFLLGYFYKYSHFEFHKPSYKQTLVPSGVCAIA